MKTYARSGPTRRRNLKTPHKKCTCCGKRKVMKGNYFLCEYCYKHVRSEEPVLRVHL